MLLRIQLIRAFQSTLPREERRRQLSESFSAHLISIHAPARGATVAAIIALKVAKISIHAPARGATNTTPIRLYIIRISIHAPARGATSTVIRSYISNLISIHAPARGATFLFYDFEVLK